jgi:ankyrin repeat protein
VQESLNNMGSSTILQDLRDRQGYTPLTSAIIHSNLEVLCRLHEFSAGNCQEIRPGLSEKDDLLLLTIINARTKNGKDILRFVLEKWGIRLAFARISRSGQSSLNLAASRGAVEVFKFPRTADPSTLQKELLAVTETKEERTQSSLNSLVLTKI